MIILKCRGRHYKDVNHEVEMRWERGERDILLDEVNGHRYIGRALSGEGLIDVRGVPGDDLGMFADGVTVHIRGNAQDGVGNTMNAGTIIVEGDVRDIAGHSMRGGKILVQGNAGYRLGIHMKSFQDDYPVIIVGGNTGDFLGEYMAGGMIIVLNLQENGGASPVGNFTASGMHGGKIFIRGKVSQEQAGRGIGLSEPNEEESLEISSYLEEYQQKLDIHLPPLDLRSFTKLFPLTTRPYGCLYAY